MTLEIITGLLVLITGFYTWQTRNTVKEMERARKSGFLPILLVVNQESISPSRSWGIKVRNVGRGPAHFTLPSVVINGEAVSKVEPKFGMILPRNQDVDLYRIGIYKPENYLKEGRENIIQLVYKDVFGRSIISEFECNYIKSSNRAEISQNILRYKIS